MPGFGGERDWENEKRMKQIYIFLPLVLYYIQHFYVYASKKERKRREPATALNFLEFRKKKLKETEKRKMRKKKFLQNLGIVRTSIIQSMHRNLNNFKLSIDLIKRTFLSLYDHPGDLPEDFLKSRALRLQSIAPLTIRSRRRETLVNVINVFVFW